MSDRMIFSTRMRADSSFPSCAGSGQPLEGEGVSVRADFEKMSHLTSLLLRYSRVLLLYHAKSADGQL